MTLDQSHSRRQGWSLACLCVAGWMMVTPARADVSPADDSDGGTLATDASVPTAPWDVSGTSSSASSIEGDSRFSRVLLQAGDRAACSKRIDFRAASGAIVCRFNVALAVDRSGPGVSQVFRVGSGFGASTADESNASTYARLGLTGSASATGFQLRDLVAGRSSPTFEGTQAITWAFNNSGATVKYSAPDGTTESIANDRMDVWVGRNKVFDDAAVTNARASISDLKWLWMSGAGVTSFGQLEARTLEPAAAAPPGAPAAGPSTDGTAQGKLVELYRPWPNPSETAVRYAYAIQGESERVDIGVFDIAGRVIRSLVHGTQGAGRYEVVWDGRRDDGVRVRGAVYFLRASVGASSRVSRVVLLK